MKKILLNTVIIALAIAFMASGCEEGRYYHQYHHHSGHYYERRHEAPPVGVDVNIHN
jgi:hypothetical protein